MSPTQQEIINLITSKNENEHVDFKEKFYSKDKRYDLIKDIVSFANNTNPHDKFIVFGVKNTSCDLTGIPIESLPDISNINYLLKMYIYPFIDVELEHFEYNSVTLGFIRIPYKNLNRPYVVSKEYKKCNVTHLREGEIYIRKGATNFIADRSDLDSIYESRGVLEISLYSSEITIGNVRVNGSQKLMGQARILIQNNTPKTVIFDDIKLLVHYGSNFIEHKIDFIDDNKNVFKKEPEHLMSVPIKLPSGDGIQKTAFFSISESAALHLSRKAADSIIATIRIDDVSKHTYKSTPSAAKLEYAEDLLKRWRR